jgi:hypothetical protein
MKTWLEQQKLQRALASFACRITDDPTPPVVMAKARDARRVIRGRWRDSRTPMRMPR